MLFRPSSHLKILFQLKYTTTIKTTSITDFFQNKDSLTKSLQRPLVATEDSSTLHVMYNHFVSSLY